MSRDSKNIAQAKRLLREHGVQNAAEVINNLRNDIPNVRLPKKDDDDIYKFIVGVCRMYVEGQLKTGEIITNLNSTLTYVASDAHIDEYDNNLNGLSAKQLIDRFKEVEVYNLKKDKERAASAKYQVNNDYEIIKVDSFEIAKRYAPYTTWCITSSPNMFNSYTGQQTGMFYFALKKGFENVPAQHTGNTALDEYGLSMIAVSVKMNGVLNTCTCRWNHAHGGGDSMMNIQQLEKLLGRSFYEAFPGRSKEELRKLGVSDKLGTLYRTVKDGQTVTGIVVRVDENDNVKAIMSLYWVKNKKDGSYNMNWYDARDSVEAPWELGSKELLENMMKNKDIINQNIDQINQRLSAGEDLEDIVAEHMRVYHNN